MKLCQNCKVMVKFWKFNLKKRFDSCGCGNWFKILYNRQPKLLEVLNEKEKERKS